MKHKLCGIDDWVVMEEGNYEVSSLRVKLAGWEEERRSVVLREKIREDKEAVGRRLLDVPGCAN